MHRHGTLKGRWKALAFGAVWVILGWWLAAPQWGDLFGAAPRAPTGGELALLVVGGLLMLMGAVLGLTPHFLWLMRALYKEDFARGARCPVMVVCTTCGTYNTRGRGRCASCRNSLAGARAAGGDGPASDVA